MNISPSLRMKSIIVAQAVGRVQATTSNASAPASAWHGHLWLVLSVLAVPLQRRRGAIIYLAEHLVPSAYESLVSRIFPGFLAESHGLL